MDKLLNSSTEVVQSGQLDSGLELVQRAARRVARPIRVRVLHPDLESSGTRVSIQQMANFSGGERLTGAILLYCALARLRSQQLGITGKRTSVLLLDNPIGTVSRVRYLDLQREVARAAWRAIDLRNRRSRYQCYRILAEHPSAA